VTGVIAEESERSVDVEIGAGLVSVPRAQVARIVRSVSPLATYQTRARALNDNDLPGWLTLGAWAQRMDLSTQAREAYSHVLDLDPGNAAAQRAITNQAAARATNGVVGTHASPRADALPPGQGLNRRLNQPRIELDHDLRVAMRRETEMFFASIVHEDRPVTELIESDYTFLNEK
ncbi:DUF1592 domain-containing protein, partial [Lacticaseibacillus rhamnosus]